MSANQPPATSPPAQGTAPAGNSTAPAASGSQSSSSISIPQSAPAGSLTITQPPQTATSYFKIAAGNTLTFAWNFTDVLSQPTSLTVKAVCDNGNTYAVGPNSGTIPGSATSVTWDLGAYIQSNINPPLAPRTYTLYIWDDRGPGAAMKPGLLTENNQLRFAMYNPASYTPIESWTCGGCNVNGSWSNFVAHPAFVSLVVTFIVMFLSGYSVLRQAPH